MLILKLFVVNAICKKGGQYHVPAGNLAKSIVLMQLQLCIWEMAKEYYINATVIMYMGNGHGWKSGKEYYINATAIMYMGKATVGEIWSRKYKHGLVSTVVSLVRQWEGMDGNKGKAGYGIRMEENWNYG